MAEGQHLSSELGVRACANQAQLGEEVGKRIGEAEEHGPDHEGTAALSAAVPTSVPTAMAPEVWAKRLDLWVIEHRQPSDIGERPVSDDLTLAGERELESMYSEELTVLAELMQAPLNRTHPESHRHLQQRKLELLERLARIRRSAPAYAEAAAHARRELKRMETRRGRVGSAG